MPTNLRVLLQMRPNTFTQRGGDTVVFERVYDGLQTLGLTADIDLEGKAPLANYDLVHLFNFCTPDIVRRFAEACAAAAKPFVVTTMYEDWPTYFSQMAAFCQALANYVLAGQPQGAWPELEQRARQVPPAPIQDNSWTAAYADALLASGEYEVLTLRKHYPYTRNVTVYHCGSEIIEGVDHGELFVRETGIKDFVLAVGRLETRKNQLMLLKALEDEDVPLVFLTGGFSYQAEYDEICRRFRRKGPTYFLGRLEPGILASAFAAARVHALPSWCELPGIVHLEAARYGTNVVATNYGTIGDYLGDAAYYCEPNSSESIRRAVLAAYSSPPRPELKDRSAHFTWGGIGKHHLQLYEEILDRSRTINWAPLLLHDTSPETLSALAFQKPQSFNMMFAPLTADDARHLLPVAKQAKTRGHSVVFILLDTHYERAISTELAENGFIPHAFPLFCFGARYSGHAARRPAARRADLEQLALFLETAKPDCLVLPDSSEEAESLLLFLAERTGCATVRIQTTEAGLLARREAHGAPSLFPAQAADLYCVRSRELALELLQLGYLSPAAVCGQFSPPASGAGLRPVPHLLLSALESTVSKKHFWRVNYPKAVSASVVLDFAHKDSLSALYSVLRPESFDYEVVVIDRSGDGSVSATIAQAVTDRRVAVYAFPGAAPEQAVAAGIQHTRGDVIVRLIPSAVALPGWLENIYESFLKDLNTVLALGHTAYRSEAGAVIRLALPPQPLTAETLSTCPDPAAFTTGYAFRKKLLTGCSSEHGDEYSFFSALLQNAAKASGTTRILPVYCAVSKTQS